MASVASFRRGQAALQRHTGVSHVAARACGVLAPALHLRAHAAQAGSVAHEHLPTSAVLFALRLLQRQSCRQMVHGCLHS
jgi:hypothetical protein